MAFGGRTDLSRRTYYEKAYWYKKEIIDLTTIKPTNKPNGIFNFKFVSNINDSLNEISGVFQMEDIEFSIETTDDVRELKQGDYVELLNNAELKGMYYISSVQRRLYVRNSYYHNVPTYITTLTIRK